MAKVVELVGLKLVVEKNHGGVGEEGIEDAGGGREFPGCGSEDEGAGRELVQTRDVGLDEGGAGAGVGIGEDEEVGGEGG